jgi:hypothetical protein
VNPLRIGVRGFRSSRRLYSRQLLEEGCGVLSIVDTNEGVAGEDVYAGDLGVSFVAVSLADRLESSQPGLKLIIELVLFRIEFSVRS